MSAGLASDEVAEDYKNSLEDLTGNDKFQISNLTVIAKENTEHAMAISRVLENHIRTVGHFLPFLFLSGTWGYYLYSLFSPIICTVLWPNGNRSVLSGMDHLLISLCRHHLPKSFRLSM